MAGIAVLFFFLMYKKKKLQNLTFLHEFSTDSDNFWSEITGKISLSWWCIFCGLSHVRFSGILKKPVFFSNITTIITIYLCKIILWFLDWFWSSVAQNNGIFAFFQIPVFLWSFPYWRWEDNIWHIYSYSQG